MAYNNRNNLNISTVKYTFWGVVILSVVCLTECEHESSIVRWPWPTGSCCTMLIYIYIYVLLKTYSWITMASNRSNSRIIMYNEVGKMGREAAVFLWRHYCRISKRTNCNMREFLSKKQGTKARIFTKVEEKTIQQLLLIDDGLMMVVLSTNMTLMNVKYSKNTVQHSLHGNVLKHS
jgi:hypothetical protein